MSAPAFTFRPLARTDLELLCEWLNRPHVAEWWGGPVAFEDVEREYGAAIDGAMAQPHIAMLDGEEVGFIQSYDVMASQPEWWPDETDPGARGVDQFLADGARLGRGVGSRMVAAFVARLFGDPAVTKVQADPSPDNARAIRAYERAGLRRAGLVHTPDGEALLMLARRSEWTRPPPISSSARRT
jgi:RimJ/RimL family protein N-acetyltransferase